MKSTRVIWTLPATRELQALHAYIAESSPAAADRQVAIVVNATIGLADFPEKGRPGRAPETRELIVSGTPYIVAYRLQNSSVAILAVIHGARRWPRSFKV
jgi:toxin ParE1/3/4